MVLHDVTSPMEQFVVGEHRDRLGRLSLYKVRYVWCGYPGRYSTWLEWLKYMG